MELIFPGTYIYDNIFDDADSDNNKKSAYTSSYHSNSAGYRHVTVLTTSILQSIPPNIVKKSDENISNLNKCALITEIGFS